ncbi:MAG: hypothetical protein U1F57_10115 [bacterium]
MKNRKIFRVLLAFSYLSLQGIPMARAGETEDLRKEVRELKSTVEKLTTLIERQNERIDQLEGKAGKKKKETEATAVVQPPTETPTEVTAQRGKKKAAGPAVPPQAPSPESSGGQDEVQSLLDKVNNAPPAPGANTRTLGLWKIPTGGGTASKLIPDISVIGTFAGGYFSKDPVGDVGVDPNRTGFTFQELELALQGVVDPYFRYDAFLSFHEDGVEIEEGYFTTLSGLPKGLQFRGGKFRVPFGRQNPKHLHAWNFADNMLVNKYLFGPDGDKELGVEMSYLFPTPFFLQFQGTFTNGTNDTSFGGKRKQDFLYQGRVSTSVDLTDTLTMLLGGSFAFGFNDTGRGNETNMFGGDFYLKWKPSARQSLSWQTEYIGRREQVPGTTMTDGGLYSYLDYQFLKRWHAGLRYDQVGIPSGLVAREYRLTPAITFQPTEFSQIRLQYEYDKATNQDPVHAAILQFMFSLGVHGAHQF